MKPQGLRPLFPNAPMAGPKSGRKKAEGEREETMQHITPQGSILWVREMGKLYRVTAIFSSNDEANAYMATNPDQGCIFCYGPFVVLAALDDKGVKP